MHVSVQDAENSDQGDWNALVGATSEGSFYHRYEWRGIVEKAFGHETRYLIARDHGQAVGVLPLVLMSSRLFGRILCSVPFMNYGGPCSSSNSARDLLVARAVELSRELSADYL